MSTTATIDSKPVSEEAVHAFAEKVCNDTIGTVVVGLATIGDRLGLFRALADGGPATSGELATRTGISERYAREWLAGMASAGYLTHESAHSRFALPPEHAPALIQEGHPLFFSGVQQEIMGCFAVIDRIAESFKTGGGVPLAAYPDSMFAGIDRFTSAWFENLLVQQWIPAVPDVRAKLQRGCRLADVGTGRGRALVKLAEAYPSSTFVGYDAHGPSVVQARANLEAAGVQARVDVREQDVVGGLGERYDVITTFDVIHDAVDPIGVLRAIRAGLEPDGTYLCLEINSVHRVADEPNPIGALLYGFSVLLCMTSSLAEGGAGLGTLGVDEEKLTELGREAGFSRVRALPLENPFNTLYELKP